MLHKDLCNVGPYGWQTMYVRKITIQCWIDPSETASHKKTTHTVLAQSAQTCFCRKTGCSFKWLVVCFLIGTTFWTILALFFFQCWLGSSFMTFGTTMNIGWHWLEHHRRYKRLFEKKLSQVMENNPLFFKTQLDLIGKFTWIGKMTYNVIKQGLASTLTPVQMFYSEFWKKI